MVTSALNLGRRVTNVKLLFYLPDLNARICLAFLYGGLFDVRHSSELIQEDFDTMIELFALILCIELQCSIHVLWRQSC